MNPGTGVAAGVLSVPLLPLTVAFFAGRVVSYSLYVGAASALSRPRCRDRLRRATAPLLA
jgi:hypothetical protein